MVLRLATAGFDAPELRFYHQPDHFILREAKQMLIDMEALEFNGTVTELGYLINTFPTSIIVARMIIEAIKRKCLSSILTIASILSNNRASLKLQLNKYQTHPSTYRNWNQVISPIQTYNSDLFVEYELWDLAFKKFKMWGQNGIDEKQYKDTILIRKQLKNIVYHIDYNAEECNINSKNKTEIRKCITAGMIHYVHRIIGESSYSGFGIRKLSKDTVINRTGYPALVVGMPVNIPVQGKRGGTNSIIPILSNCTTIELAWLEELAPHLIRTETKPVSWNYEKLMLTIETVTYFRDYEVARVSVPAEWSEENVFTLACAMSHVFLPENEESTNWIERLRTQFFERGYGYNHHFAIAFANAIVDYKTLLVEELEICKKEIADTILFSALSRLVKRFVV